ncbi:hypothetical protein [Luteirhabdus pelagi]|uniref:hypothetical protein n=1 Tax=Luteirhabdus pelagi TaxID=2792783 RepID=UPI001939C107|nr:hypothetical protein [Luteirhabdus pelagi]
MVKKKIKLTHIINPVAIGPASDLYKAQPITFETMRRAKAFASPELAVKLVSVQYPEDHEIIPDYFTRCPDLERSVMDVGTFKKTRKLPLLQDILNAAKGADPSADYIIYTNVDIALLPQFYDFVREELEKGHDALVINRRTIHKAFDMDSLAQAYSAIGQKHPGFDCFIVPTSYIEKLRLGTICIGANWIGRTFYANLCAIAKNPKVITDAHATFHIGEDGAWLTTDFSEFDYHNKNELYTILEHLKANCKEDVSKGQQLEAVKAFMDDYGNTPPPTDFRPAYNPSRKVLLKKKIKEIVKIVLNRE